MANLKVSEQAYPSTRYTEGAAPSTPASGEVIIYAKADGLLYSKDDAGVETLLDNVSGTTLATDTLWDAAGDLVQGTGANTAAKLSAGTAGKVLTSNGAAAALTWETPAASGAVATDAIWDAAGDLAVGTGANTAAKLSLGAAGTVPVSNGTTLVAGYPAPNFRGWVLTKTSVSITSGAAWTVSFASEVRDTDNYHDNSTNPTRCTVSTAVAGLYAVTFSVRFPAAFTGTIWTGVSKNTTWQPGGQILMNDAGATTDRQVSSTVYVEMANTDYLECGGLFTGATRSDLSVQFVGRWLGA